jgi:hypothetical protein
MNDNLEQEEINTFTQTSSDNEINTSADSGRDAMSSQRRQFIKKFDTSYPVFRSKSSAQGKHKFRKPFCEIVQEEVDEDEYSYEDYKFPNLKKDIKQRNFKQPSLHKLKKLPLDEMELIKKSESNNQSMSEVMDSVEEVKEEYKEENIKLGHSPRLILMTDNMEDEFLERSQENLDSPVNVIHHPHSFSASRKVMKIDTIKEESSENIDPNYPQTSRNFFTKNKKSEEYYESHPIEELTNEEEIIKSSTINEIPKIVDEIEDESSFRRNIYILKNQKEEEINEQDEFCN